MDSVSFRSGCRPIHFYEIHQSLDHEACRACHSKTFIKTIMVSMTSLFRTCPVASASVWVSKKKFKDDDVNALDTVHFGRAFWYFSNQGTGCATFRQ